MKKRFNVFDLIVVLIIIFLAFGIFLKVLNKWTEYPNKLILVRLKVYDEKNYVYNSIKMGDEITNIYNKNNSRIVEIAVISENRDLFDKDLLILAELEVEKRNDKLFFDDKEIRIGNSIKFSTHSLTNIPARIVGIDEFSEPYVYENIVVTVKLENVEPWLADKIKKGSKEVLNNRTIAVITKKTVAPAKIVSVSDSGDVGIAENPLKSDVEIEVKLRIKKVNGDFFFKNKYINVGKWISFNFEDISFEGQIISID